MLRTVAVAQGRTWGAGADLSAACEVRLARADAIIAVQKKLADLLGIPMTPDGGVP